MNTSKAKTFEDLLKHKTVLGSQGPGAPSYDTAYLVQKRPARNSTSLQATTAPLTSHSRWNAARSTVSAAGTGRESRLQKPEWVRDRTLNLLAQVGINENDELTKFGVPTIWKFIADEENRKIAEFILAQKGFERPLLVRAGTPPELVNILRTAFDATMRDPQFLADADKGITRDIPLAGHQGPGIGSGVLCDAQAYCRKGAGRDQTLVERI